MPTLTSLDNIVLLTSGEPARLGVGTPQKPAPPLTIRRALTQVIESGTSDDPVASMDLSLRIFRAENGAVDLTDRDVKNLQELIEKDRTFANVVKASLITALKPEALKEKTTAEKK